MLIFDVPFLPDNEYVDFLNKHIDHIYSLHVDLFSPDVPDARPKIVIHDNNYIFKMLRQVETPRKYVLLNTRFHDPAEYFKKDLINSVIHKLSQMINDRIVDGIVYADQYYLNALSEADKDMASQLEAIPSINFMADSYDKVEAILEGISMTHFKLPGKFLLDRSLNRHLKKLADMVSKFRKNYPEMKLTLLANEGCIYQCPFKLTHDSHISYSNIKTGIDTYKLNKDFGCMDYMMNHPYKLFKSPFIRPEDLAEYKAYIDIIKICGRTIGPKFLKQTIKAYMERSFDGNLLELFDSLYWLSNHFHVSNKDLPDDSFQTMTSCKMACKDCSYCKTLFDNYVKKKDFKIKNYSDY